MSSEGSNKNVTVEDMQKQEDAVIVASHRAEKELIHVEQKGRCIIETLERVMKYLDNTVNSKPYYGEKLTLDDPEGHVSVESIKRYLTELEAVRNKVAATRESMIRLKFL